MGFDPDGPNVLTIGLDPMDTATLQRLVMLADGGPDPLLHLGAMKLAGTIKRAIIEQIPGAQEAQDKIEEALKLADDEGIDPEQAIERLFGGVDGLMKSADEEAEKPDDAISEQEVERADMDAMLDRMLAEREEAKDK